MLVREPCAGGGPPDALRHVELRRFA